MGAREVSTAGQEQTQSRSPSAHHALSALPPAAWAPFSWGQLWWQWHGLPAGSPISPTKGQRWRAADRRSQGRSSRTRPWKSQPEGIPAQRTPRRGYAGNAQANPKGQSQRSQRKLLGGPWPSWEQCSLLSGYIQLRCVTPPTTCHHHSSLLELGYKHPARRHSLGVTGGQESTAHFTCLQRLSTAGWGDPHSPALSSFSETPSLTAFPTTARPSMVPGPQQVLNTPFFSQPSAASLSPPKCVGPAWAATSLREEPFTHHLKCPQRAQDQAS